MRGLYSLVLQDKKPVYMVPIKDFSVSGIEKISGDMKSAGDFIDGQRYTYKDFAAVSYTHLDVYKRQECIKPFD